MADLGRTRKRIITAIAVFAAIDVAGLVYLALPLRAGAAQPAQVQQQADEEYRQLSRTTVPLRGIDQKLTKAQKDDATFIQQRLPVRYSEVVEELGKVAAANHITITTVAYKTKPEKLLDIDDLEIHAGLDGQYVDVVKFMNALERDKMFFIIDSIGLTEHNGQKAGEVRLDMKLDSYLRGQSEGLQNESPQNARGKT